MCVAGQTGASLDEGAGMTLELADIAWPPRGLIDASEYGGIQFWLWVSPDTATSVSSSFLVQLIDKNQIPGGGVCNENANGITACAGAQAGNSGSAAAEYFAAGPLFADDGSGLTSLSGGWQHVRAPWSSFVPSPAWGGANEQTVDPRTLAVISFFIVRESPGGGAIPFDFCVYELSFLPKAEVPGLDGGAVLDGGVQSAADSGVPVDVQLAQD
jgi:hypothetical protein